MSNELLLLTAAVGPLVDSVRFHYYNQVAVVEHLLIRLLVLVDLLVHRQMLSLMKLVLLLLMKLLMSCSCI